MDNSLKNVLQVLSDLNPETLKQLQTRLVIEEESKDSEKRLGLFPSSLGKDLIRIQKKCVVNIGEKIDLEKF